MFVFGFWLIWPSEREPQLAWPQSIFADPGNNESKSNIILATSFLQLLRLEHIYAEDSASNIWAEKRTKERRSNLCLF